MIDVSVSQMGRWKLIASLLIDLFIDSMRHLNWSWSHCLLTDLNLKQQVWRVNQFSAQWISYQILGSLTLGKKIRLQIGTLELLFYLPIICHSWALMWIISKRATVDHNLLSNTTPVHSHRRTTAILTTTTVYPIRLLWEILWGRVTHLILYSGWISL